MIGFAITAVALASCYSPPPIPLIKTPIPVTIYSLFLGPEDLPPLSAVNLWQSSQPRDQLHEWEWSNAIAAMDVWNTYGAGVANVIQTIVQYGDDAGAEGIWRERRNYSVDRRLSGDGEIVELLREDALPPLHADNIWLRCEQFSGPQNSMCAARLQYDVLYVEIVATIAEDSLAPTHFYKLLEVVDARMRPVWEASPSKPADTIHQ